MKLQHAVWMLLSLFVGCKKEALPPQQTHGEPARLAVTHWTGSTELFMEYSSLVGGQTSRAAIHLTQLGSFKPLTEGKVRVELKAADGTSETFSTEGPSRPGIFGVNLQPKHAGSYTLVVRLESATLADVHELGRVTVYIERRRKRPLLQNNPQEKVSHFSKNSSGPWASPRKK